MRKKGFIAWLLVLTILFTQGMVVSAEEKQDSINTVTETFVNPWYRDVIQESDLTSSYDKTPVSSYANTKYITSKEECASQIREGMKQRNEEIVIYYKAAEYVQGIGEEITNLALEHTGNPCEGDYIKWQYAGGKATINMFTDSDGMCCMQISYTYTYYTNAEQEAEVDMRIKEVLAELDLEGLNDYQKIKTIYQYICTHTAYDHDNKEDDAYVLKHTAYAALIDGKAVCQGYALLFYRMALELGIDNRLIPGKGNSETHGWNIVKLNGVYYNVDSTWDAGKEEYKYFLKCDSDFDNHTREKEYADDSFYANYPMAEESYVLPEICMSGQHQYQGQFLWTEETGEDGTVIGYSKVSANIVCDLCGETHKNVETNVTKDEEKEPTCTEEGMVVYKATAVYDEKDYIETRNVVIKAKGHDFGEWVITKPATKKEEGCRERTCKICSKSEEEVIPKLTSVQYRTHIQSYGWIQGWKNEGETSGTSGESLRLEAIEIKLIDPEYEGGIEYRTHVQNEGWQEWETDGQTAGTEGKSLRLEAIQIRLTGEMAEHYDIYYSVHAQNYGWLDWAKNGELAGTAGYSYRLEAIRIMLVEKGSDEPGNTNTPYHQKYYIGYKTHAQDYGWLPKVYDGAVSGTVGKSKRLEAIQISFSNAQYNGDVEYKSHIQNIGWEKGWKKNGALSGTEGKSYRLEAIQIRLTGEMSEKYDIYYRVHAQTFGWLDWASNGQNAGTAGYSKRLEAIEIVLVEKHGEAPGKTNKPFVQK